MTHEKDTQTIAAKLHARENSTLVFATVAASASLIVLALVLQTPDSLKIPEWVKYVGLFFSILGPLYRCYTIFTVDRIDYKKIPREDYSWWATVPRMIIVRFFLYLPIGAWVILLFTGAEYFWIVIASLFAVAAVISVIEWRYRNEYTSSEKKPTSLKAEETSPLHMEEIENRFEKVDRLFDIVLVLITAFSATTLTYVSVAEESLISMTEIGWSFRTLTIPWIILILLWLIRGLLPSESRFYFILKMALRQFCWAFFFLFFNLIALFFFYLLYTQNTIELFILENRLGFIFIFINFAAMWNYARRAPELAFFKPRSAAYWTWTIVGPFFAEFVSWVLIRSIM